MAQNSRPKTPLSKRMFSACMFAKHLVEEDDRSPGLANKIAGDYYGFTASQVGKARTKLKKYYRDLEKYEQSL